MDMPQSDYDRIQREIFGGPPNIRATFSLSPEIDAAATAATGYDAMTAETSPGVLEPVKKNGFIVYRDTVVVEERADGTKDYMSVKATDEHRRKYPDAWKAFETRKALGAHDVRLCPGITPAVTATLEGIGIRSLEGLAKCDLVLPDFIEQHRAWARRFLTFLAGGKPKYRLVGGTYEAVA